MAKWFDGVWRDTSWCVTWSSLQLCMDSWMQCGLAVVTLAVVMRWGLVNWFVTMKDVILHLNMLEFEEGHGDQTLPSSATWMVWRFLSVVADSLLLPFTRHFGPICRRDDKEVISCMPFYPTWQLSIVKLGLVSVAPSICFLSVLNTTYHPQGRPSFWTTYWLIWTVHMWHGPQRTAIHTLSVWIWLIDILYIVTSTVIMNLIWTSTTSENFTISLRCFPVFSDFLQLFILASDLFVQVSYCSDDHTSF